MLSIEIDSSAVEQAFGRAAARLKQGYPVAMKRIGQKLGKRLDTNIRTGNYAPLAASTIKSRRHLQVRSQGRYPIAGLTRQLRVTDTLRKASIATNEGAKGSAYHQDSHSVQVGPDEQQIPQARRIVEGWINQPARDFLELGPEDPREIEDIFAVELRQIARDFNGGRL